MRHVAVFVIYNTTLYNEEYSEELFKVESSSSFNHSTDTSAALKLLRSNTERFSRKLPLCARVL